MQHISTGDCGFYSVVGIINTITHDKGFYYLACQKCKKKVVEEEGKYKCSNCDTKNDTCNVVYMFKMRLDDGTGCLWVNVFGDVGTEITGKSAEELKKLKESGNDEYEKHFDEQRNKVRRSLLKCKRKCI